MFNKKVSLVIAVVSLFAIFGVGFGVATFQKSNQKSQQTANAILPDTQALDSVKTRSEKTKPSDAEQKSAISESEDTKTTTVDTVDMTLANESKFTKVVDGSGTEALGSECGDGLKGMTRKSETGKEVYLSSMVYSSITNPTRSSESIKSVAGFLQDGSEYNSSVSEFFRDYCVGGFAVKYSSQIKDVEMKHVDSYQVVVSLEGQSEWLSPAVHIVGKKGNNYFNISKSFEYDEVANIATLKKCPLYATDFTKSSEFPDKCMYDLVTKDTAVQKLLLDGAQRLATDFEFVK